MRRTPVARTARIVRWLFPLLFLSLAVGACGGFGGSSSGNTQAASSTPALVPNVAVVTADHLTAFSRPDASSSPVAQLGRKTPFGSQLVIAVLEQRGSWLHVLLPQRPNGSNGWLRQYGVSLSASPFKVRVDTNAKTLVVTKDGQVVRSESVAVGTGGTPTPTGTFFITDVIRTKDANGPYGPYAFGLSAHSNVLKTFDGGDGQIGIHGTNAADSIGKSVSHGCIRMSNGAITALAKTLPLGTQVEIG